MVNKADKKNVSDLRDIIAKIRSTLDVKGIRYVDVLAFTSRPDQVDDDELEAFIQSDTDRITAQIEAWNSRVYESSFARNFKIIFSRCKEFYEDEIEEESRKLTRLNTSLTRLSAEDIDMEVLDPLQLLVREAQRNVNELKEISRRLKDLQDEFFTEIKIIADLVGIAMPEPSEIDLLQDRIKNPMQVIEEYKQAKGIQTDTSCVDMLQNLFAGIDPVIRRYAGGSEYRSELVRVIREFCTVEPSQIRSNDVSGIAKQYSSLMRNA